MNAILEFDVTQFRLEFKEFANPVTFPDATLQMYWDIATQYISNVAWYGDMVGESRQYALNCLTAHLTKLNFIVMNGEQPGIVTQATIDKISDSFLAPPVKNQWQWWLNLTPYGAGLLALLRVKSVGGWLVGGPGELSAFRRVGGVILPSL